MSKYKVSVVMSVYNDSLYLVDAIKSILSQSFCDFEFIIVDDGSTDNSASIICKFNDSRIKLLTQEHNGLSSALNYGILNSTGCLVIRMDADDISLPNRIEKQVKFMEKNPEIALIGGSANLIDNDKKILGKRLVPSDEVVILDILPYSCPMIHPTLCFRRELFDNIGGYREIFTYSQDYDFILRAVDLGYRIANIPSILLKYRTNKKQNPEKVYVHARLVLLAQKLHRQRDSLLGEDKNLLQTFSNTTTLGKFKSTLFNIYYKTLLLSSLNAFPKYLWRILNIAICLFNIDLIKVTYNDYMFHAILRKHNKY